MLIDVPSAFPEQLLVLWSLLVVVQVVDRRFELARPNVCDGRFQSSVAPLRN